MTIAGRKIDWTALQTAAIVALVGVVFWLRVDVSVAIDKLGTIIKAVDDHETRIRKLEAK